MPGVPSPRPAAPRRPGIVTGAAAILLVAGTLYLLVGLISLAGGTTFVVGGNDVEGALVSVVLLVGGAFQVLAGWLVLGLRPAGRILGIVVATLGIVGGLLQLGSNGATGVLAMLLDAFVLYALLTYGFVFEQASATR
jgi:hypothetical protein